MATFINSYKQINRQQVNKNVLEKLSRKYDFLVSLQYFKGSRYQLLSLSNTKTKFLVVVTV